MRRQTTVTDLVRNFADYINRVAYRGESFLLTRGSRVVAELRPVPEGRRLGELEEILAGVPHLSRAQAEKFATDVDAARAELGAPPEGSPWAS